MIAHRAEWWTLEEGMYLRDTNGKTWRIVAKRFTGSAHEAVLVDRDGERARISLPGDHVVDLMVPTETEVLDIVRQVFPGATVIAVEDVPAGRNIKSNRFKLTRHLIAMHGLGMLPYSDVANGSLDNLREIHALASAKPWEQPMPHAHFPLDRILDGSLHGLGFSSPPAGSGFVINVIDPDKEMAA